MLFSVLTCSVTFPSQARSASSMIEVIKEMNIMRKLISFDYAKEVRQNIEGGPRRRQMWMRTAML